MLSRTFTLDVIIVPKYVTPNSLHAVDRWPMKYVITVSLRPKYSSDVIIGPKLNTWSLCTHLVADHRIILGIKFILLWRIKEQWMADESWLNFDYKFWFYIILFDSWPNCPAIQSQCHTEPFPKDNTHEQRSILIFFVF